MVVADDLARLPAAGQSAAAGRFAVPLRHQLALGIQQLQEDFVALARLVYGMPIKPYLQQIASRQPRLAQGISAQPNRIAKGQIDRLDDRGRRWTGILQVTQIIRPAIEDLESAEIERRLHNQLRVLFSRAIQDDMQALVPGDDVLRLRAGGLGIACLWQGVDGRVGAVIIAQDFFQARRADDERMAGLQLGFDLRHQAADIIALKGLVAVEPPQPRQHGQQQRRQSRHRRQPGQPRSAQGQAPQ